MRSVRSEAVLFVRPDKGGLVRRLVTGDTDGGLEGIASVAVRIALLLAAFALIVVAALPLGMILLGHDVIPVPGWWGVLRRPKGAR